MAGAKTEDNASERDRARSVLNLPTGVWVAVGGLSEHVPRSHSGMAARPTGKRKPGHSGLWEKPGSVLYKLQRDSVIDPDASPLQLSLQAI